MSMEYDAKGKVFTHIVHKNAVYVRIQTVTHQIAGEIYLAQDQRIKDELEFAEKFIAVTSARVLGPGGQLVYESPFITLNRDQIVWLAIEEHPS
nr:hypothetical protein [Chloroflexota bacterium]